VTTSFQLVNEFPDTGPRTLGQLLCTSRLTVVWGPVYSQMDAAFKSGQSLLSPEFFLELLERENSPVRVASRAEWLRDKAFRNRLASTGWAGAKWQDGFDDRIRDVLDDDLRKNLPAESKRVVVAPPDSGWERAGEVLSRSNKKTKRQLELIANDPCTLPSGIAQRIERSRENHHPIEALLRDVLNHDAARIEVGAQTSFLDAQYLSLVERITRAGVNIFLPNPSASTTGEGIELNQARETIDLLQPIQTPAAYENWFSNRHTQDREQLLRLFESPHRISIREEILERLLFAGRRLDRPIWEELLPELKTGDIGSRLFTLGSLVQALWLLFSSVTVTTALARIPMRALARYGRRSDWPIYPVTNFEVNLETNNMAAVFQLVFGTRSPSESQFRAVLQALNREIERAGRDT
jgi:hypothetical protein